MKFSKKVLVSTIGACLLTSGIGVYAGTVLERYKTARGNIATVEPENVHKNRIGITVNGKKLSSDTWYANGVTYAPMREVANMLGASVNYNSTTQSADIVTESELLNLLGIKIRTTYYGNNQSIKFTITDFNPSNNEFSGTFISSESNGTMKGKLSENKMIFTEYYRGYMEIHYELTYDGANNQYIGKNNLGGDFILSLD